MTGINLINELAAEVRLALADYNFPADRHVDKPFTVYPQFVSKAKLDNPRGLYHPLIVVALNGITDDEEGATAEVGITFSVYGEDDDTWYDLLNALETVRLHLLTYQSVGRRFRLLKPLESEIPEAQPAPFFYGLITARYLMYQPEERRKEL